MIYNRNRMKIHIFLTFTVFFSLLGFQIFPTALADNHSALPDEDSATVLLYHRFNNKQFSKYSISTEQFTKHIHELKKEKYHVIPLPQIAAALKAKKKLPNRAIAVTIDGGYISAYHVAWPLLHKANLPFTIFIPTKYIGRSGRLTWDQIREMSEDPLVTIGHNGNAGSIARMSATTSLKELGYAADIFKKQLGKVPTIFAHPLGEFSEDAKKSLKNSGIKTAFGQYSSALNSANDQLSLPRFFLNDKYGTDSRFKLIINTRALPVIDILPRHAILKSNPPLIGFTVDKRVKRLKNLNCFPSHLGKAAQITILGGNRVEVRFDKEYPKGRGRLNCTMPGPNNRVYWFGMQFFIR